MEDPKLIDIQIAKGHIICSRPENSVLLSYSILRNGKLALCSLRLSQLMEEEGLGARGQAGTLEPSCRS